MKAVLSLLLRPQVIVTVLFFGVLVFAFQNCQQGGAAFGTLTSTCVSNCGPDVDELNDELIKVAILDGDDGRLDLLRTDSTLTVFGSCSRGGFPTTTITAKLKRFSAPNPTKTLTTSCSGGGWQVMFTGIQDYSPSTNAADLNLEVSIVAQDHEGETVTPAFDANGQDYANVVFAGVGVNPTPSPAGAGQTLSIYKVEPLGNGSLAVSAYIYPCLTLPNPPLILSFTSNHGNGTVSYGAYPPTDANCAITMNLVAGAGGDTNLPANGRTADYAYSFTLAIPSAGLSDSLQYTPLPAGKVASITHTDGSSPFCYETAASPYVANSVRIEGRFFSPAQQSFDLSFEYRNLTLGSPWRVATVGDNTTSPIALNANSYGSIILKANAQNPTPNRHIHIYRIMYTNAQSVTTRIGVLSKGKPTNQSCN